MRIQNTEHRIQTKSVRQRKRSVSIAVFILSVIAVLTSCQFRKELSVDFTDLQSAKSTKFNVLGMHETDLSNGLPYDCYLPDGTPLCEWSDDSEPSAEESSEDPGPFKTSSVTGTAIYQQLLQYGNQNKVIEIIGTYKSVDVNWDSITLSGKVMLPRDQKPKRMILVSHYTVGSNAEAPSNCFSLEGILVKLGYGLVIPDYQGYGVTADQVHPYLVMDVTARQVVDMYLAVRDWLKAADRAPEYDDIYLMGYSQGGAVTMAVEQLIEYERDYDNPDRFIKIHRVFAGGGPYDVKATYERFVNTDTASYPVAVPLVLQGMIVGNNLNMQLSDMMQPWLCDKMDEWVNSKRYTTAQINALIGTKVTHKLVTEEAMDQRSDKVAELYKAMTSNSIVAQSWSPLASVYILHSMDDETVPYTNATNAKSKWRHANITYNFGHYGSHTKTCLRFIYSVQSLLIREEEERRQYE